MRNVNFDFSPKTKPFGHQTEAIEFIKRMDHIALFDEQGLGKTKIVIDALCSDLRAKAIDSVLVICKKSLLHTWRKEIAKHSYLQSVMLSGSKRQRGRSLLHFKSLWFKSVPNEI